MLLEFSIANISNNNLPNEVKSPVFKNIVESICFNKKEKRHDKGTM